MSQIFKTIYLISILTLSANNILATTCAEVYQGKADGWLWKAPTMALIGIAGLPLYGVGIGMFIIGDSEKGTYISSGPKRRRVAELLEAAEDLYVLRNEAIESNKSEKVVAQFYNKYILKKNPSTPLVIEMVVDELVKINRESVELGLCHNIFTRRNLAQIYFAGGEPIFDQNADLIRQSIKQEKEAALAEQNKLQNAQTVRNQNKEKYRTNNKDILIDANFVSLTSETSETSSDEQYARE